MADDNQHILAERWGGLLYILQSLGNAANFVLYLEGNVLFNDALSTFYLRLYGVRHVVKGHSDSERKNR